MLKLMLCFDSNICFAKRELRSVFLNLISDICSLNRILKVFLIFSFVKYITTKHILNINLQGP